MPFGLKLIGAIALWVIGRRLLAGASLAVGTAWSGLLANFAAGVFLMILRPFRAGDFVTAAGVTGTVGFDTNRVIREAFGEAGFPAPEQLVSVRQSA